MFKELALSGALLIGGTSVAACQITPKLIDGSPMPITLQTPEPTILDVDGIILGKAKKDGIVPSKTEQDLWLNNLTYPNLDPNLPIEELAPQKINAVVNLMAASENKYFQEAIRILPLLPVKLLVIGDMHGRGDTAIRGDDTAEPAFKIEFAASLVQTSNPILIANKLTLLLDEVRRTDEFAKSLALKNLSTDEKKLAIKDFFKANIVSDPEGYALEAKAYIEEAGLLGQVIKSPGSGMDERAAVYAQLGDGPKWDEYILKFNESNPNQSSA